MREAVNARPIEQRKVISERKLIPSDRRRRYREQPLMQQSSPQRRPDSISMPVGRTVVVGDKVVSTFDRRKRHYNITPKLKSYHEMGHGVYAGKPKLVTNIPGPGLEGLTIPGSIDPHTRAKAALAPRILFGPKGTEHDVRVAMSTGANLKKATEDVIVDFKKHRHRIEHGARTLEAEKVIFEEDFPKVMREADSIREDEKKGVAPVTIWDRNGNRMTFKAPANDNVVKIPTKYLAAA